MWNNSDLQENQRRTKIMTCDEICKRYKAIRGTRDSHYELGYKYCEGCEILIEWDGLWCPCCGFRIRSKRKTSKNRVKMVLEIKRL